MKCLFTDILTTNMPDAATPDPAFQLIPGTRATSYQLAQGIVLVQEWAIAPFELLFLQGSLLQTISFEIRQAAPSDIYLYGLTGKMDINTFQAPNISLHNGHGHYFTDRALQAFCTLKKNQPLSCLLIICLTRSEGAGSLAFTISPAIQEAIDRILFSAYSAIKYFHVTQVATLLHLSKASAELARPAVHFGADDLAGIQAIKAILDQSPNKAFTLLQLSQKAGMNMRKLNIGFKNLYQQTIFDYLHDQRLKSAHEKITHSHLSLKIIGRAAGYRSYANFSAAFKSFFGYTPSSLRKR